MFEVGLGLPQPGPQFSDPGAEVVGQGPGLSLLDAGCVKQGLKVHAATVYASRQVRVFSPVRRRHDLGHGQDASPIGRTRT
jgi:hypothetical protein